MTRTRSPPSSCWTAPIASRWTVPLIGVVIAASIFIASMVATVCPASTFWPSWTVGVTAPANGAAMWPGRARVGLLRGDLVHLDRRVPYLQRAELPVEREHHGAHAALVRLADALHADQQPDALVELDRDLLVGGHAVQVRRGVEHADVPVLLADGLELLGRARGTAGG